MNPSILYYSKGHGLYLVGLMAMVVGLCVWFLLDHQLFPKLPPPPAPIGAFDAPVENLLYLDRLREAQPREGHGLDQLTGGWASALVLIACIGLALWEIWMKSWRLFSPQAALVARSGQLVPHPSFLNAPTSIAFGAVRAVTFDRSDRIRVDAISEALTAYSLTNRLAMKYGARLRHTLLIDYVTEGGEPETLRINDNEIEGGAEQLAHFAAYVKQLGSRGTHSIL